MRLFSKEHSEIDVEWYENSRYLACLAASSERELEELILKCQNQNLIYSVYREPDFNDEITAIVIEPSIQGKKVTSCLPLSLRFK